MKNKIFIIIINYNGIDDTRECVKSIYENVQNLFTIKTIIVDNASDSYNKIKLNELRAEYCDVEIIFNSCNLGFAKANNIGMKFVQEKYGFEENSYIWFLNNDTLVNQILLKNLSNNLPHNKVALYFEMRNFENRIINNGLNYLNPFFGRYSETFKKNYIEYICGASIFLKNTKDVPYWNEEYFLYFEDVDYSLRLKRVGFSFKTVANCWYNHKVNGSSKKNSKVNIYKLQSQKKFMKENGKCYSLFIFSKFVYLLFKRNFSLLEVFIK